MKPTIDAVLFDIGGTLRRTIKRDDLEKQQSLTPIQRTLRSDMDGGTFARVLTQRMEAYANWSDETLIELNEADLWTRWLLPDFPQNLVFENAPEFHRIWRNATGTRTILPEVPEIILQLFRGGYRLGIVSNTTSPTETPRALETLGISGYFDVVVLSCDVGLRKPNPDILRMAACRMGIAPERCAYVGDNPYRDIASARQAGFAETVIVRHLWKSEKKYAAANPTPDHKIEDLQQLLSIFPPHPKNNGKAPSQHKTGHPSTTPPRYTASLSTMWGAKKFHNLGDFFIASDRLGFSAVELNHMVNTAMLTGLNLKERHISSIHEPCPADISTALLKKRDWLVSSTDEDCRQIGVESIKRSIDLANELGVPTIVMHAGMIPQDENVENTLRSLYQNGLTGTDEYADLKNAQVDFRARAADAHLHAVIKSLEELLEYARLSGIRIGLENRYHYLDIPSQDEMAVLLDLADADRLGFIYDVGHAQAMEQLGFYPHEMWLKRFASRMYGTHLHDVRGIDDHWPPGLGEVDYKMVASYLPAGAFRTCEILGQHSVEQIRKGLKILVDTGCINQIE